MIWLRSNLLKLALAVLLMILEFRAGVVSPPQALYTPVTISDTQLNRELNCLAKNIYFESRGEPFHGKVAVAQVTINRVQHDTSFKSTICGVVYEKKQFSWTADKLSVKDKAAWNEAMIIAKAVVDGSLRLPNFDALYFHTKQVRPSWRKTKKVIATIGNHIFYA